MAEEMKYHFIESIKTKRYSGEVVKTTFGLSEEGVVVIERIFATRDEIPEGFFLVRQTRSGSIKIIGQHMVFKYDSFVTIAMQVLKRSAQLDSEKIIRADDVIKP